MCNTVSSMEAAPRLSTAILLLSLLLLWTSEACVETAWSSGQMDSSALLQTHTIASSQASSCACCALCHQQTGCASVSFNAVTSQCKLYNSVASYATLQPDSTNAWSYFVMPGRSGTGQFCRRDSDCVTAGDFCRGRFCTSLDKVTCRTIADNFEIFQRYGEETSMYGWLDNKQVKLECWMTQDGDGFTTILWSPRGVQFNSSNTLMKYNLQLGSSTQGQSLLYLAEDIRQSKSDPTYKISIWAKNGGWVDVLKYDAPRGEAVLSDSARTSWTQEDSSVSWNPSMLWMPNTGGSVLLTTNADDGQTSTGAMATSDGNIDYDELWVYMLE